MNDEQATVENQVGLYHDPASGQYVGLIDPIQADAAIRAGWELHTAVTPVPGKTLQQQVEELSKEENLPSKSTSSTSTPTEPESDESTPDTTDTKKGRK